MASLNLFEISDDYINYLHSIDSLVPTTKQETRKFKRKYIGIVFNINEFNYYVNLSSFKSKHFNMKESIDFIKIGNKSVINLNNMIPIIDSELTKIDINKEEDVKYKNLLIEEYRIISKKEKIILKNAKIVYNQKINNPDGKLAKRCCDFKLLEEKSLEFQEILI